MFLKGPLGAFGFFQEKASFVDPKPAIEIPANTISTTLAHLFKFVLLAGPPKSPGVAHHMIFSGPNTPAFRPQAATVPIGAVFLLARNFYLLEAGVRMLVFDARGSISDPW